MYMWLAWFLINWILQLKLSVKLADGLSVFDKLILQTDSARIHEKEVSALISKFLGEGRPLSDSTGCAEAE